ncbi:MAG: SDR family oxidoreductase [Cyclobacteriaceae bacterium]
MKNFVIIGGSSGIGNALALQLASSGNNVYATYKNTPVVETQGVRFYPYDVLADNPAPAFLPDKIDGLVYCPGSIDLKPFARIKPEDFTADFNLQVMGAVKIIQAALPKLRESAQGAIVLFSTVAVKMGFPFHSKVAASKGAIEGLTRALAAEFAPKIRVNCISPSITDTPLAAVLLSTNEKKEANAQRHPLKSIGKADDIASMAAYLLSDQGKWITGQIFSVDGGMSSIKN